MKMKICKKFPKVNKLQRKLAEAFPDDTILIKKCINLCGICKHAPLVKIKGHRFSVSRISKLVEKINTKQKL